MPCYHPMTAWQRTDGEVVFAERGSIQRQLTLPCGQCVGCRLERSRQWAVRILHEAKIHKHNCFLTLTYDDEHLPRKYWTGQHHPKTGEKIYSGDLALRDVQLFLKKLRKKALGMKTDNTIALDINYAPPNTHGGMPPSPLRYYLGAEYGEQYGRPHYHLCLFGIDLNDKLYVGKSPAGHKMYTSKTITETWEKGIHSLGELTFESAAYTARYIMKKITGNRQKKAYERQDHDSGEILQLRPEFNTMSRRKGIGQKWLEKFNTDVYPKGKVIIRGHQANAPRYYDKQFKKLDQLAYEEMQWQKELNARPHLADQTDERLAVKEIVTRASIQTLKRKI